MCACLDTSRCRFAPPKTSTRTQIKAKHEQQNLKLLNAELNNIKKLLSELFQINTKN